MTTHDDCIAVWKHHDIDCVDICTCVVFPDFPRTAKERTRSETVLWLYYFSVVSSCLHYLRVAVLL